MAHSFKGIYFDALDLQFLCEILYDKPIWMWTLWLNKVCDCALSEEQETIAHAGKTLAICIWFIYVHQKRYPYSSLCGNKLECITFERFDPVTW